MTEDKIKEMNDNQLKNILWSPTIDDIVFDMISDELKRRGYVYQNGWVKITA